MKAVTVDDIREIALSLISKAKGGDVTAVHELLNRVFGKAKQEVDVTSGGESITFTLNIGHAGSGEPSEN